MEVIIEGKLSNGRHEFEIVEEIPSGYSIWNIGSNMVKDYLPLCQSDNLNINPETLKAIKVENAQIVMSVIGIGPKNPKEMETYTRKYANSKNGYVIHRITGMKKAIEILKTVKGWQNL